MRRISVLLALILLLGLLPCPGQAAALEVGGKSAVLMDAATGTILFEQNAHEPLALLEMTSVSPKLIRKMQKKY